MLFSLWTFVAATSLISCATGGRGRTDLLTPSSSEEIEAEGVRSGTKNNSYGEFILPPGYNKLAIPIGDDELSVYVYVSLFIRTILSIDELNGEITLDADIGLRWVDWKIYHYLNTTTNWTDPKTGKHVGNRTLDSVALKEIWKPDVFIDQMASVDRTSILANLIQLNFLSQTNSTDAGDIVYSARSKIKLRCDMNFEYYPADTQICEYYIRSYSYHVDQLTLHWKERQVFLEDPSDANFDLQVFDVEPDTEYLSMQIEEKFDDYRRGNYSTLLFIIKARRKLSYHVVQTYLPSVLLILITWLCFLIPSNMVEARIGISMTTVLTLTAMFSSVRQQSPRVSYTMAIDTWMVFNIFFVFIALLLFTLIYWMKLRLKRRKQRLAEKTDEDDEEEASTEEIGPSVETYQVVVRFTKKYAFWAFAITFSTFLVTYWGWLLSSSGYFDWKPDPAYNTLVDGGDEDEEFPWSKGMYLLHTSPRSSNNNESSI